MRGFFRNILNQKVVAPTFVNIVQGLWNQVLVSSEIYLKEKSINIRNSENNDLYSCIQSSRTIGYNDLNLDNAPNHKISSTLLHIGKKLYEQKPGILEFF